MIFFSVPVFRAPPGRCANPRRSSSARKAHQDRRDEEKTPLLTEDREELKRLLEEEMKALSVAEKKRDEAYKRLQDALRRLPSIIRAPPEGYMEAQDSTYPDQDLETRRGNQRIRIAQAEEARSEAESRRLERELAVLEAKRALGMSGRDFDPSHSPQHSVPATGPRTHAGGDSSASQEASSGSHASSSSHRHRDVRRSLPPSPPHLQPPASSPSRPAPRSSSSHPPQSATAQKRRKGD
ncbi:hypothetical protein AAP_05132 [Ascosphaera apis ARSEF 7405]|uniref:Uncharacterized protein n=1 Tax=Ascosphaera apis ARSEF 7405 TaxID=392613 RepID=A0A167W1Z6_9EURO|nr:hypothetical protein AAP_05132 [Ascosphaera apis ARSEF 7405]